MSAPDDQTDPDNLADGNISASWFALGPSALEVTWRALAFVAAAALLLVVTLHWSRWQGAPGWQTTDDAYLQADLTPISAKVPGYLRALPTGDFQTVRAGQLVALIADNDYRAVLTQAQANLFAATTQLGILKAQRALQRANVKAAQAVIVAASADLTQSDRDLARQHELYATGSSSLEAAEKLQTLRAQLNARRDQDQAQAEAAARQLDVLAAQDAQVRATVDAQAAVAKTASINLGYTRVVAPQDGVLGQRQVQPGQFVSAGGLINTLTPLPHVWVIANYKETQLTHMAVGQAVEIQVDTFPGRWLRGHVEAFAPGSGAQFALLPPDNATGNFTKVVQRIAVKIAIDDADGLSARLRAGMSVVTRVNAEASVAP
jgi:membrane fusion protein (multidrug efflux system)